MGKIAALLGLTLELLGLRELLGLESVDALLALAGILLGLLASGALRFEGSLAARTQLGVRVRRAIDVLDAWGRAQPMVV